MNQQRTGSSRNTQLTRADAVLFLVAMALTFAACQERSSPEQRREALTARARALEDETTKTNSISPAHRQAFDGLVADVRAYNASTNRFDVSVERATFITPAGKEAAAFSLHCPSGAGCCTTSCPSAPPNRPKGYVCYEDGGSYCSPDPLSGTTTNVCSYRCVKVPFLDGVLSPGSGR